MKYDGLTIYSARDEFGLVEVVENRATRKLYFDSPIEQSCLYLNAPMTLNFEYQEKIIDCVQRFAQRQPKHQPIRVLMLGMGGGSMAHHLFHTLPNLQMTVVELRQIVIDCAYRFFHLPDAPEIDVVNEDALSFIADNQHHYDCIIVDIFDAQGLPSALSDLSFQEHLGQSLKSRGQLLFNLWYQWDEKRSDGKPIPTPETEAVVQYWQTQSQQNPTNQNTDCLVNRYNIQSSQNLIVEILKH